MAQFFGIVKVYGGYNAATSNLEITLVQTIKSIAAKATPQVSKFLLNRKSGQKVLNSRFFVVGKVIPVEKSATLLVTGVYPLKKQVKKDSLSVQLSGILMEFTQSLDYQDQQNGFLLEIQQDFHTFFVFLQSKDSNMQKYLQILQGEQVITVCKIQANRAFQVLHTLSTSKIHLDDGNGINKTQKSSPLMNAKKKQNQYKTTKTTNSTTVLSKTEVAPGYGSKHQIFDLQAHLGKPISKLVKKV